MFNTIMNIIKKADIQAGQRLPSSAITFRQEILGVALFSVLFTMWGLAYGLLDIMNYHIKVAMGTTRLQASLLALSYYIAYIPGSLVVGGPVVKRFGYRAGAVLGLLLLMLGDEVMSLGAGALSLVGMCGAHFVVGLGVSVLERTANPYVVQCGPRARAAVRILLAQSCAALGTVVAPVLANAVIFDPKEIDVLPLADEGRPGRCLMPAGPTGEVDGDLSRVVSFYRFLGGGIAVFALVFAAAVFRTRWVVEPEVPQSPKVEGGWWKKTFGHPLVSMKFARLWFGVVANFFSLGCQVTVAQFFIEHMRVNACATEKSAATDMMVAQILFLAGRLVAAVGIEMPALPGLRGSKVAQKVFRPRWVLLMFLAMAVGFTGAGIGASGKAAVAFACLVMFAESPSFPMIFEAATAGMCEWTPTGESLAIVSICGGGILPMVMGALSDVIGVSKGWSLVTACFGIVLTYSVMCNAAPSFRMELDATHDKHKSGESYGSDTDLASRAESAA